MIDIRDIVEARARIGDQVHHTPLLPATRLGAAAGVGLRLKCENLQKTGSFKARGALNAILCLDDAARARGVLAVSAGNHAQAVAWAAAKAGVASTVVMPATASPLKVAASRGYGAEIVQFGASGIEAFAKAREIEAERGFTFIHPFDDLTVAAGAGTLGLELVDDDRAPMDVLVIPVGGGGLLAGVASAIRGRGGRTRVIGVEPTGSAVIRKSLDAGRPVALDRIDTIADGLGAPMAGARSFPIIRDLVDDVVLVSDDEIRAAMRDLLGIAKLVAEPAAAAALAAVTVGRVGARPGDQVTAVISGGNVDLSRLAEIADPRP